MNNKTFEKWFVMLVLVIFVVLVYRVMTVEIKNRETLQAISKAKDEANDLGQGQWLTTNNSDDAELPYFSKNEMQTILERLQPHQYHEDAYIEARVFFELNRNCKYSNKVKPECDEIVSRFNKIEDLIDPYQDVQHIPASTELGKALKKGMRYGAQQPELYQQSARHLLKTVIQSKQPHVLSMVSTNFVYRGIQYGEILPFTEWLGSQDQDYNGVVLMYALLKMANQFELTNEDDPNGLTSFMFCTVDKNLCGSGFEASYNLLVMPGMKKDVDLMILHLEQFAWDG